MVDSYPDNSNFSDAQCKGRGPKPENKNKMQAVLHLMNCKKNKKPF